MKRTAFILILVSLFFTACLSAMADGTRVFNNAIRPWRLLAKQYNGNADVFPITDPSPAGSNLPITAAMGRAPNNGVVSLNFYAGFTAPITLTAYCWNYDSKTQTNGGWVRAANVAAAYQGTVDTNYAQISFSVPAETPFLIMASDHVTGSVYCSANTDPNNPGSTVAGYGP